MAINKVNWFVARVSGNTTEEVVAARSDNGVVAFDTHQAIQSNGVFVAPVAGTYQISANVTDSNGGFISRSEHRIVRAGDYIDVNFSKFPVNVNEYVLTPDGDVGKVTSVGWEDVDVLITSSEEPANIDNTIRYRTERLIKVPAGSSAQSAKVLFGKQ